MTREGAHHRAMKVEDVPPEWVKSARDGWWSTEHGGDKAMAHALAFAAPLIAKQERERMEAVLRILDFDGGLDAWANLKGALIDMEHAPTQPPDAVCWNTLNRVLGQLFAVRAAIRAMSPEENSR